MWERFAFTVEEFEELIIMAKSKSQRRWYEYPGPASTPQWVRDVGNKYQLGGIVLEGEDSTFLVLLPTSDHYGKSALGMQVQDLSPEMWSELLRRSDDPLVYGIEGTGKAWMRKVRSQISGSAQQRTWVRDGLQCLFCGAKMGDALMTIDHFIPLEVGGRNDMSNYITACRRCNKAKGSLDPEEYCDKVGLMYQDFIDYLAGRVTLLVFTHLQ